jgi:hypothetical protein
LLDLAQMCQTYKKMFHASAQLYERAFKSAGPAWDDLHRYQAARAAALAASGQGDAVKLPEADKARWRGQARAWLEADVNAHAKRMKEGSLDAFILATQQVPHWHKDAAFACIRDPKDIASLSEEEKQACQKLWADVAQVVKVAEGRLIETRVNTTLTPKETSRLHQIELKAGKTYIVDLETAEFDMVMKLVDARGKMLAQATAADGEGRYSRIVYTPRLDATVRLVVSSHWADETGAYVLRLREAVK